MCRFVVVWWCGGVGLLVCGFGGVWMYFCVVLWWCGGVVVLVCWFLVVWCMDVFMCRVVVVWWCGVVGLLVCGGVGWKGSPTRSTVEKGRRI